MKDKGLFEKALSDTVRFHSIYDEKYKTEYLTLFFSLPLTAENSACASLTARVLQRGSRSFPTMKELSCALDENYACSVGAGAFKCGEREIFSINLVNIKDRYALSGEKIFDRGVEILLDLFFNPLVENGAFLAEYVEGEKQNLIDSINAQINNKAAYSKRRFIASMCAEEAFSVNGEGDVETVKALTPEKIFDFYKNVIMASPCDIFYVGEKNGDEVCSLFSRLAEMKPSVSLPETEIIYSPRELKRVEESLDIAQGHLWIGFRTGITYSSKNYLDAVLFNMVLGGDVTGKMFMNLREKMSLCYTCHSSMDSNKGLLMAYAGIDPSNVEKTEKAFFEQLDKIRSGEITDEEISDAKKSFANRMREIMDNPSLLPLWYFMRLGTHRDPESDARDIERVSREDIVKIANSIIPDTVYVLAGKGSNE